MTVMMVSIEIITMFILLDQHLLQLEDTQDLIQVEVLQATTITDMVIITPILLVILIYQ